MRTTYVISEKSEIIVSLQPQKATNKSLNQYLMLRSVLQCLTSTMLQDFNKNQALSQNSWQGITTPKRHAHGYCGMSYMYIYTSSKRKQRKHPV